MHEIRTLTAYAGPAVLEFKPDEVEGVYVSIRKEKSSENYSIDDGHRFSM